LHVSQFYADHAQNSESLLISRNRIRYTTLLG
jgi:hypothetical protein